MSFARARAPLAAAALALLARALTGPLPLNYYDSAYTLFWGRELDRGALPDYHLRGASTPHPLATLYGALAAPLGVRGSWYAVQALLFVALGVTGVALYALTRHCTGSRAAGAIACAALLASPPMLTDGLGQSAISDLPATALVLSAAALAVRRGGPGSPAIPILLALAGLLRPEAWVLAGCYWLWCAASGSSRRELAGVAALTAAAPLLWIASDLAISGSATYSLTHTRTAVRSGLFASGLGAVPRTVLRDLRALDGTVVMIVGAAGALLSLAHARLRRAGAVPLALLALSGAEFAALGLAGVPLIERFLITTAALLAAFFAGTLIAGRAALLAAHPSLRAPSLALVAALLAYVGASDVRRLGDVRPAQRVVTSAEAQLISLAPAARALHASCGAVVAPGYELVGLIAYDLDVAPGALRRLGASTPRRGVVLWPATRAVARAFSLEQGRGRSLRRAGFVRAAGNSSWLLLARGCVSAAGAP